MVNALVRLVVIPVLLVVCAIGGALKSIVDRLTRPRDPRIAALAAANRKRKGA